MYPCVPDLNVKMCHIMNMSKLLLFSSQSKCSNKTHVVVALLTILGGGWMLLVMLLFTPDKKLVVNVKLQLGNFRFCLSSEFNVILPLHW
jgi:hypothetical protein